MKAAALLFGFALLGTAASQATDKLCGLKKVCAHDARCLPLTPNCKNLDLCPGRCWFKNDYPLCGPHIGGCPRGFGCGEDPRKRKKAKKPKKPDESGICIPDDRSAYPKCGGVAGIACPVPKFCYDNPWDSCNPLKGGTDCPGICI